MLFRSLASNTSTMPPTSGSSIPTTVRSMPFSCAKSASLSNSIAEEQDSNAESQEESQETTDNTTQELNIAQSLDGVTLPADSEQITYTYHGNVCNAAKTATGLYLLPVVQDDSSVVWYVYNEETDKAIQFITKRDFQFLVLRLLMAKMITLYSMQEQRSRAIHL